MSNTEGKIIKVRIVASATTINEVFHDETLKGTGQPGNLLGVADSVLENINSKVADVQVNGESVVEDNTANITVGNATLTIQKNGTDIDSFTANATSDKSINIEVPTKLSDMSTISQQAAIDSGITSSGVSQITTNKNDIATINGKIPATASSSNKLTDKSYVDGEISSVESDIATINGKIPSAASSSNQLTDKAYVDGEITTVEGNIADINAKIPEQASASNKLADKNFVNSSISTNTANFIGTFNSVEELEAYSGTVTNNDYAFVISEDSSGNTIYNRYKYTTATTPASWQFEYALNNSSFTADQWGAINSGATTTNIAQIATNTTTISGHIADKNNPHEVTKAQVGLGNVDNTSDLNKPISTATQTALDEKVAKNADITGATKCKITYDNKGLVTAGADLAESDIPSLHLSKISDVTATATELNYVDGVTSPIQTQLNNKADSATTLDGYGITDAYTKSATDTLLNAKADTSLSNLTSTGKANIAAEGTYNPTETYDAGTVGAAISGKANVSLDNLTSTGANIGNWSHNVSNCLVEIPQDLNIVLSSGSLIVKAGSKGYLPDGTAVSVANDITVTASSTLNRLLFLNSMGTGVDYINETLCYSGTTAPTVSGTARWFDTTNNVLKQTTNGGSTWTTLDETLPIAIFHTTSGSIDSVKVFNGFCYIGSTIFALPGVKAALPNGRNSDGTLKNTILTNPGVNIRTVSSGTSTFPIAITNTGAISAGTNYVYNEKENRLESSGTIYLNRAVIGQVSFVSGKITSLEIKTPFHAVDYNDIASALILVNGYDATKTQTLKHVQGAISWVDDA